MTTALVRPDEVLTMEGGAFAITFRFHLRSAPDLVISQQMGYLQAELLAVDPVEAVLATCRRKVFEALQAHVSS